VHLEVVLLNALVIMQMMAQFVIIVGMVIMYHQVVDLLVQHVLVVPDFIVLAVVPHVLHVLPVLTVLAPRLNL
jgi:hypothetical protein